MKFVTLDLIEKTVKAIASKIIDINSALLRSARANGLLDDALLVDTQNPNTKINMPHLVGNTSRNKPDDMVWGIREIVYSSAGYLVTRITGVATDGKSAIWTRSYSGTAWESTWQRYNNTKTAQTLTATVNVQPSPNIGATLVTFAKPFTNPPFVFVSPTYTASITTIYIANITTTGFTVRLQGDSQATTQMQFLIVGD